MRARTDVSRVRVERGGSGGGLGEGGARGAAMEEVFEVAEVEGQVADGLVGDVFEGVVHCQGCGLRLGLGLRFRGGEFTDSKGVVCYPSFGGGLQSCHVI